MENFIVCTVSVKLRKIYKKHSFFIKGLGFRFYHRYFSDCLVKILRKATTVGNSNPLVQMHPLSTPLKTSFEKDLTYRNV